MNLEKEACDEIFNIAGFYYAMQKYGALTWKQVMEPAIFYAENGFPVYPGAYIINSDRYAALTLRPNIRQLYAPNGFLPPMGSIFKQPELDATPKKISEQGADYFYKGPFARQAVKEIQNLGGKATLEDFSSYRALELEPVRGTYKGYEIAGPPIPATGTVVIIEAMNILENLDLKTMGHYSQSADTLQWLIETIRVVFHDSYRYTGIDQLDSAIAGTLVSKEYAKAQIAQLRHKIDTMKHQAGGRSSRAGETMEGAAPGGATGEEDGHTNHVSTVDKDGNIWSFTHTIYGPIYSAHGLWVGNASAGLLLVQ